MNKMLCCIVIHSGLAVKPNIQTNIHTTYIHPYMHNAYIRTCACIHTYILMYVYCKYIYTYIHKYIHKYIHTVNPKNRILGIQTKMLVSVFRFLRYKGLTALTATLSHLTLWKLDLSLPWTTLWTTPLFRHSARE